MIAPLASLSSLVVAAGLMVVGFAVPGRAVPACLGAGLTMLAGSIAYGSFWLRRCGHHLIDGGGRGALPIVRGLKTVTGLIASPAASLPVVRARWIHALSGPKDPAIDSLGARVD